MPRVTARLATEKTDLQCVRCSCGQVLALRIGPNHYRALGADVIPADHSRQVFVCPVCGRRTRVPRCASDETVIHNP